MNHNQMVLILTACGWTKISTPCRIGSSDYRKKDKICHLGWCLDYYTLIEYRYALENAKKAIQKIMV
jgi:hypothetical protein